MKQIENAWVDKERGFKGNVCTPEVATHKEKKERCDSEKERTHRKTHIEEKEKAKQ